MPPRETLTSLSDQLIITHKLAQEKLINDINTMKNKNDILIGNLKVTQKGNDQVIKSHESFLTELKKALVEINYTRTSTGASSNQTHSVSETPQNGQNTRNKVDPEILRLTNDSKINVQRIAEAESALANARAKIQQVQREVETLTKTFQTSTSTSKNNTIESGNRRGEQFESLTSIDGMLNKFDVDFKEESRSMKNMDKAFNTHVSENKMPKNLHPYKPVSPFNVTPGAFMVGAQENRDSNNGFHELSARIANLARQINRVTAV